MVKHAKLGLKTHRHTSKKLTKRDKAHHKLTRIKKGLLKKKQAKLQKKKKASSIRRQAKQQADEQLVDIPDPRSLQQSVSQSQFNMLQILGLAPYNDNIIQSNHDWQSQLEQKLQQVSQKSLDNPQVRRVYSEIGKIFSTYRSGKIPRAFKIIPNLEKWRQILQLTHPEQWTPQAMFQAVNIFASNFDALRAELFYRQLLVPALRTDMSRAKKLNYHYFKSLKKALYKTNAWFKGILFELCGNDTLLRQIKMMQSLLSRMSIPVISSSVAMLKMMEMPYSSAIVHYLSALLRKNYSFPRKVITILTEYLLKFQSYEKELPIVWHQLLLTFAKQYSSSIDEMGKGALIQLTKSKHHKLISPQIVKLLS